MQIINDNNTKTQKLLLFVFWTKMKIKAETTSCNHFVPELGTMHRQPGLYLMSSSTIIFFGNTPLINTTQYTID